MATAPERLASHANQACGACKKQKRRCDRAVPECSLCRRTGRVCEYNDAPDPPPTAAAFAALQRRLRELEERLNTPPNNFAGDVSSQAGSHHTLSDASGAARDSGQSTISPNLSTVPAQQELEFPAALFLDIDCFVWARLQIPDPSVGIPVDVLALLSQGNAVVDTSADYFDTIHTWMPIVSKKRMDLGIPVQSGGPDIAMLFLAMKLITAQADEVADGTLYSIAKSFLSGLEGSGVVSLLCLQAMVLIALYEYSHSIYPAAWMTVGACARYAEIIGLSCGEMDMALHQVTTWTGAEERRRVWWAIFILDRLISMGSRRPCSVTEPPPDGKLPVDDEAWDTGDVTRALGLAVSTHYQVHQSFYARLCQAAIYVGRAEACARSKQPMSSSRIAEIMSLAEELSGFSAAMNNTPRLSNTDHFIRLLGPSCLVRSALFIALDFFTCPEKLIPEAGYIVSSGAKTLEELKIQSRSMQAVQQASQQAHSLAMELSAIIELDEPLRWQLGKVSPFILDLMYCSIATLHWLLGENGDEANKSRLKDLQSFMEMLGTRWRLSKKYIEIASFHDVSKRMRNNT